MQNVWGLNNFHTHHSLGVGVGVGIGVGISVGVLPPCHCFHTAAVELLCDNRWGEDDEEAMTKAVAKLFCRRCVAYNTMGRAGGVLSPFVQAREQHDKRKRSMMILLGKSLGCKSVKRALLIAPKWIL
jgi:hypothetical protein